jgi:hypothetical protein
MIERVRVGFSTLTNHQMNDALSSPLTITDATSDADGPSRIKRTERGTTTGNKRRSLVEQQNMSKSRVLYLVAITQRCTQPRAGNSEINSWVSSKTPKAPQMQPASRSSY